VGFLGEDNVEIGFYWTLGKADYGMRHFSEV
jgi:hypothetical protein